MIQLRPEIILDHSQAALRNLAEEARAARKLAAQAETAEAEAAEAAAEAEAAEAAAEAEAKAPNENG